MGQLDQFITGSEINEGTKPNEAAASRSHMYAKQFQLFFALQTEAKTDIVCKAQSASEKFFLENDDGAGKVRTRSEV